MAIALDIPNLRRIQAGRHAKSMMLLGLRGVGKTVLLVRIGEIAESVGYVTAVIEAPEERRLAGLLVPKLRRLLYRISRREKARVLGNRALGALRNQYMFRAMPDWRPAGG